MNWTIAIIVIALVIVGIAIVSISQSSEKKAEPTVQYTKPIGPTQEYPYRLDSQEVDSKDGNKE